MLKYKCVPYIKENDDKTSEAKINENALQHTNYDNVEISVRKLCSFRRENMWADH